MRSSGCRDLFGFMGVNAGEPGTIFCQEVFVSTPITHRALCAAAGALLLAACSDGSGPGSTTNASLSFAVGTGAPAAVAASVRGPQFSSAPISAGGQTLTIDQVQVVLSEVELKQAEHSGVCTGEEAGCEEFEAGPVLVDLPVSGGVISPLTDPVPEGTYSEAELKVDVPSESDAGATAFQTANPTWPTTSSVRVTGTFDANDGAGPQPFDVYLDGEAELEMAFNPPMVVAAGDPPFNVTVAVDVNQWFVASGGSLIDPRALATDSSLLSSVLNNIEHSFHAFEDEDKDGETD